METDRIYIYREREREIDIYIHTYTYAYVYIYIYIYIYIHTYAFVYRTRQTNATVRFQHFKIVKLEQPNINYKVYTSLNTMMITMIHIIIILMIDIR